MRNRAGAVLWLVLTFCVGIGALASESDPFSNIPAEQRQTISKRLDAYVEASKERNWDKLYNLVSDTGKAGVDRKKFDAAMKSAHGTDFAQDPDLLEFKPDRTEKNDDGYDMYGCARDRFEGKASSGVAVVHGVFEHNDWFFTGWTYTVIPNQACSALSDPKWQPTQVEQTNGRNRKLQVAGRAVPHRYSTLTRKPCMQSQAASQETRWSQWVSATLACSLSAGV